MSVLWVVLPKVFVWSIGSVCKVTSESMEDEIPVDDENSPIPTINEVEGEEEDYNSDNKVNNEDEE